MKVVLISVDGMRPDSLDGVPFAQEFIHSSSHALDARTVFPSVTLPCHMSMFHSVDPERHGVTTNVYTPQVRPINGLCEQLVQNEKTCAFFFNWEELRDLSRPGSLVHSYYRDFEITDNIDISAQKLTDDFAEYYQNYLPDFSFIYYGMPDVVGHNKGWMCEDYLESVKKSWDEIERVVQILDKVGEDYAVIITADHGGHERSHGSELPEDMIIPIIFYGADFEQDRALEGVSIKDIAPTIASLLETKSAKEWEGKVIK